MKGKTNMKTIAEIIRNRHSERGAFETRRLVPLEDLEQVLEAARWAPTHTNMQNFEILVVDDKAQLEAIAKVHSVMSEAFLKENYNEISFSEDELRKRKTGMLASEFPAAWTNPEAWNPESDYRFQMSFLGRSVQSTPLLLIVLYDSQKHAPGSESDSLGHTGLGCVLENIWLMSESLGIGCHVVTVFSDSSVEEELKQLLRIPPHMKIAFACALGYPVEPRTSHPRVRRALKDFVHHNRFGLHDLGLGVESK